VSQHILVVDPDVAFATMLAQSLEEMGNFEAAAVPSGKEALQAVAADRYDLVIVDMAVADIPAPDLVRRLRQEHPSLPLMVIPLEGDQVPPELSDVEIQGTLPKPFFLPELPGRVAAAMSEKQIGVPEGPPSSPSIDDPQILQEMSRLAQEVGAKAVVLTQGERLLAQVGQLSAEEAAALASAISESWRTSARVAKILGKEQLRFEQSIEGEEHLLYSLALVEDLTLSALIEGKVPLGMIRHRAKETAEAIRKRLRI